MLVWLYHPEKHLSHNLRSAIFQKSCEIGGQVEERESVSVPTEGQAHLLLTSEKTHPGKMFCECFLQFHFSQITLLYPHKREVFCHSHDFLLEFS